MCRHLLVAAVSLGVVAVVAGGSNAQAQRYNPQVRFNAPYTVRGAPPLNFPALPQPRASTIVDARGTRWLVTERQNYVWDARQNRMVPQTTQSYSALGTNQINQSAPPFGQGVRQRPGSPPTYAPLGTNQINQSAPPFGQSVGTQPGSAPSQPRILGTNVINQNAPVFGQSIQPPQVFVTPVAGSLIGQNARNFGDSVGPASFIIPTSTAATVPLPPEPWLTPDGVPVTNPTERVQMLFDPGLGIIFEPVPYDNGTIGARLTRDPLPNSPVAQIPLKVGDTVFSLNGSRFNSPNEVVGRKGRSTLEFVGATTGESRSASIVVP
jgi:hypothetical protein